MKIGIITFCEAVNYGAFLQAFSLGEFLKENNQDVEYITTRSLKSVYWNVHNLYAYHLDRIAFRNEFRHKWNKAQKKLKKTKKKSGYDLVIIGSDEMWQLNGKTVKPLPEYWGVGIDSKKIITYAVCSNGTSSEQVRGYQFVIDGIRKLDSISVRDTRTQSVYQELTDKEIDVHVDPTFLVDLRKYAVKPQLDKYLLVYTYSFDADKIKRTKEFAKQKGLKIVAVGNKFDWCDFSLPASPFEVLGLFMNAEYVVTDTFHGTALSIHFHRQFCTFADGKEKILELIKEFHLEHRNACKYETLSEMEQVPVDYEKVSEELKEKRDKSQRYLRGFIS